MYAWNYMSVNNDKLHKHDNLCSFNAVALVLTINSEASLPEVKPCALTSDRVDPWGLHACLSKAYHMKCVCFSLIDHWCVMFASTGTCSCNWSVTPWTCSHDYTFYLLLMRVYSFQHLHVLHNKTWMSGSTSRTYSNCLMYPWEHPVLEMNPDCCWACTWYYINNLSCYIHEYVYVCQIT